MTAGILRYKLLDKLSKSIRTEEMEELFAALSKSKFRSRFRLSERDRKYVSDKGMDRIRKHAEDFIRKNDWRADNSLEFVSLKRG